MAADSSTRTVFRLSFERREISVGLWFVRYHLMARQLRCVVVGGSLLLYGGQTTKLCLETILPFGLIPSTLYQSFSHFHTVSIFSLFLSIFSSLSFFPYLLLKIPPQNPSIYNSSSFLSFSVFVTFILLLLCVIFLVSIRTYHKFTSASIWSQIRNKFSFVYSFVHVHFLYFFYFRLLCFVCSCFSLLRHYSRNVSNLFNTTELFSLFSLIFFISASFPHPCFTFFFLLYWLMLLSDTHKYPFYFIPFLYTRWHCILCFLASLLFRSIATYVNTHTIHTHMYLQLQLHIWKSSLLLYCDTGVSHLLVRLPLNTNVSIGQLM